ncbi:MAG: transporter substrate-binding domain-containing protein [Synergistaceae bacterium]|nr:transporter substrate-binding domain-containing protein [Synergistaceae bacterium]
MKKFLAFSLLVVMLFAASASAETIVGRHSLLNATEQQMLDAMKDSADGRFYVGVDVDSITLKFYDSLVALQLALDKGDVDLITVPLCVGQYMLNTNHNYVLKGLDWWFVSQSNSFNFAFMEARKDLQERFNKALAQMKRTGALGMLEHQYVTDPTQESLKPVEFNKFEDAETITVAVTGDMPPLDYIAENGTPAGYNTALLAAIGRIMNVNIRLINIDTLARAAALQSGRADVVFWFQSSVDPSAPNLDVPEGIILSDPYFKWNEQYFIGKK